MAAVYAKRKNLSAYRQIISKIQIFKKAKNLLAFVDIYDIIMILALKDVFT